VVWPDAEPEKERRQKTPPDVAFPRPPPLHWGEHCAPEHRRNTSCNPIKDGDFYTSTGVELKDYQADTKTVSVTIRAHSSNKYRVQLIGRNARILQDAVANSATCAIKGDEGYVRVKVTDSDGENA
jgi:hypothetical protein